MMLNKYKEDIIGVQYQSVLNKIFLLNKKLLEIYLNLDENLNCTYV